jgi:hypothetical protein
MIAAVVLTACPFPDATVSGQRPAPAQQQAPTISAVRAHLFRAKTADWSEDVLARGFDGWNTIAGPDAANATLIVLEISGSPGGTYTGFFGPATKYTVRLVAREAKQKPPPLLDRTQPIPVLGDQGKAYVPFLLYQRGCSPIRLTATIVGAKPPGPIERTLAFACGE